MTPTEKLQKIRARCVELLAIAEKRTQGNWRATTPESGRTQVSGHQGKQIAAMWNQSTQTKGNAAYISACAGAAEAGWRATIAAIDGLLPVANYSLSDGDSKDCRVTYNVENQRCLARKAIEAILAAWEGLV